MPGAVSHVKSDTIADWTNTVTVFDSAGNTGTVAASDLVRPSDWNSVHNEFLTMTGHTAGSSTMSGSNIVEGATSGIYQSASTDGAGSTRWLYQAAASVFPDFCGQGAAGINMSVGTSGATGGSTQSSFGGILWPFFLPFELHFNVAYLAQNFTTSVAGTGSCTVAMALGLYTLTGSTLSSVTAWYNHMIFSQNSQTARSQTWWWGTNSTSNTTTNTSSGSAFIMNTHLAKMFTGESTLTPGMYYAIVAAFYRSSNLDLISTLRIVGNAVATTGNVDFAPEVGETQGRGIRNHAGIFTTTINTNVTSFVLHQSYNTSIFTTTGFGNPVSAGAPFIGLNRTQ